MGGRREIQTCKNFLHNPVQVEKIANRCGELLLNGLTHATFSMQIVLKLEKVVAKLTASSSKLIHELTRRTAKSESNLNCSLAFSHDILTRSHVSLLIDFTPYLAMNDM